MTDTPMHLAVSLDGAGVHPAAWRDASARPEELFTAAYWIDVVRTAERGLLDFVAFEDTFGIQSSSHRAVDDRTDEVRGRFDAVLVASHIAPTTTHIGLVPAATTTYPEPFHLASSLSTLDYVSKGRGGWQPRVSGRPGDAALVGVRSAPEIDRTRPDDPATIGAIRDLFDEAADAVDVVRRLWDSWEDDAIIKDVATGRFVDRDKLHYVDFEGRFFSVKGPSIVPRPPQGNPLVTALVHSRVPFEFAARSVDVAFVTPADAHEVPRWVGDVRAAEADVDRTGSPLRVFADLVVVLADTWSAATARKEQLDTWAGRELRTDAAVFVGTPGDLADELDAWRAGGLDGFRLRPAVIGRDLDAIVDDLVPVLQERGSFRGAYEPGTLRERLGLGRPASRYAIARSV